MFNRSSRTRSTIRKLIAGVAAFVTAVSVVFAGVVIPAYAHETTGRLDLKRADKEIVASGIGFAPRSDVLVLSTFRAYNSPSVKRSAVSVVADEQGKIEAHIPIDDGFYGRVRAIAGPSESAHQWIALRYFKNIVSDIPRLTGTIFIDEVVASEPSTTSTTSASGSIGSIPRDTSITIEPWLKPTAPIIDPMPKLPDSATSVPSTTTSVPSSTTTTVHEHVAS